MESPTAPAAPAQPAAEPAPPLTPSAQALKDKDFSAYRTARREEREGKTPPAPAPKAEPVAATPAEPAPAPEPPKLSKRQQEINDRAQRAAEAATEQLRRENADLRAQLAARDPRPVTPPAAAPKESASPKADPRPDPNDQTKYPDGRFDEQFIEDLADWKARAALASHDAKQAEAREQETRARSQQDAQRAHETRVAEFSKRCSEAEAADPHAFDDVDPQLFTLEPTIVALQQGKTPTFGNVIADLLIKSESPHLLMRHLSDKAEQRRLAELDPVDLFREIGRIEQRLTAPAPAVAPPTPVTNAPPPPTTLGTKAADPGDPLRRAVAEQNFPAYRAAKLAQRMAMHR